MPTVSVIIPAYNQAKYLPDAINSIIEQSFTDWECIIVNDGSLDNTHEVVKPYLANNDKFIYITQPNRGLAATRNRGLDASSGKYIQFLDADDLIDPNKIALQVALLEANSEFDVAYSDFIFFYDKDVRIFTNSPEDFKVKYSTGDIWELLLTGNFIVINAALINKDAIIKAGLFDSNIFRCEDYDLWLRIANNGGKFIYSSGNLAFYRISIDSMSSNRRMQLAATINVINKIPKYHKITGRTKILVKRYLARLYMDMAVENIRLSKYLHAIFAAIRSYFYDPEEYKKRQIIKKVIDKKWFS